jgi:hypothetical protein
MTANTKARKAALADRKGREFLHQADHVLGRVIDAHAYFRPRAWMDELPPLDAFGALVFQVAGQQQRDFNGRSGPESRPSRLYADNHAVFRVKPSARLLEGGATSPSALDQAGPKVSPQPGWWNPNERAPGRFRGRLSRRMTRLPASPPPRERPRLPSQA